MITRIPTDTPLVFSFTSTGTSEIVHLGSQHFAMQVSGDPVAADAWSVVLEGGLDGVNFNEILTHITGSGDGKLEFTGGIFMPVVYYRCRVLALTLGSATKINVSLVGAP